MKKILSTLVMCVILGVSSVWAETYTITNYNNTKNGTNGSAADYKSGFDGYVDANGVTNKYVTLTHYSYDAMQDGAYIRPSGSKASQTGDITLATTFEHTYIHSFSTYFRGSVTEGRYNPVALRLRSAPAPNSRWDWSSWSVADETYAGASADGVLVSTTPNASELKVFTGNPSAPLFGKNNYASLRNVSVEIWIPEVKMGNAQTGKSSYGILNKPMAPSTSTEPITLTYDVSEGVNASDFTAIITMDPINGSDNQGSFSTPSITFDAAKQQVNVSFTYTSASGEDFATSYRAVLRLESANECDDSYWETIITGAAGEKKIPNELKWTLPEKLYVNSKVSSPTSSNSTATITYTSSNTDVAEFIDGELYLNSYGQAVLSANQPAEGQYEASNLPNCTIQVEKRTPKFDFNPKGVLYPNKAYSGYIFPYKDAENPANDNDPNNNMNPVYSSKDPLIFTVDEAGNVTTLAALDTGYLHVEVEETEEWNEYRNDFPVTVERDPIHVPLCLDENLFNNNNFIVEKGSGIIVWENNALRMGTSHSTNPITISCTMHVTGSLGTLEIANITAASSVESITIFQSVNNTDWTLVDALSAVASDLSYELNPASQYIKIEFSGKQTISIHGLCITEKVGANITPDPIELVVLDDGNGGKLVMDASFTANVSNLTELTLQLNSDDFILLRDGKTYNETDNTLLLDYTDGLGIDKNASAVVQVHYVGDDPATALDKTCIVTALDENDVVQSTATIKVIELPAGDIPAVIIPGIADRTGIFTGTEMFIDGHATYSKYPYRKKEEVNLSAAFNGGVAAFDQLFIFGLTTGDASGNITIADLTKGSNASTPCYIYVKDGNNYKLSSIIPNVNVKDRPSEFEIKVSGGKKYYFTGYSPYTSCGYQWEKSSGNFVNGVFSFVGERDVNLYVDNLQLYARPKSENGSLTVTQQLFEVNGIGDAGLLAREDLDGNISLSDMNVKFYTQGSGSAFCFQPIKNGATLQPTIHLKGENILESTQGVYLIVKVNFVLNFEKEASQISAPIQVVHNKNTIGTSTNLTIDDWWGGERTNGSLNLATMEARPAPTIDLGSDKTTLNINGGQLFLSNSFNSSTEYDVSYAISYRMKSMLDGLAVIYGIGDDQPGATVLFNDGTINCKPLPLSLFNSTQGQKLFHNPTSMKCPKNTFIRGGSFNCDVLACSTTTSKGASPKNAEDGDNLCMVTIPIETLRANNTATLKSSWKTDVVELGAKPEANIIYKDGVHTGYNYYRIDCMTPQTIKDEGGNDIQVVNLMLPSNLICFKEVLTTDWALCFPKVYVKAIEEKDLGGDIEVDYSISKDDGLTKVVKTSKFLYGELDQYMVNIVNGVTVDNEEIKYSVPNKDGDVSITVSLPEDGISKSVTNTQPFAVYDKMYMLMPLVANQWEMFVPPFDVANIYVVETYPEDKLIRDFDKNKDGKLTNTADGPHEIDKARYAQSARMMDLFYQWLWSVDVLKSNADIWYSDGSLWGFMLDWLNLYKDLDSKPTTTTCLQQLYHYHPTATYPSGKYWWDANFYLYQAVDDTWKYENGELQVKWEEVPTISQRRNPAGKHNVIMKKGQVYVMSFPSTIVNNEVYDYVNTWDYWTGKYIIIEGYPEDVDTDGNGEPDDKAQMISGSLVDWQGNNISETILAPYAEENSASLRGNSTFAKLDVSKIKNAFVLNNYLRGKSASDDTDKEFGYGLLNSKYPHNVYVNPWDEGYDVELTPGQGFILANFTAPKGMRAKAINLQSGEIAFGNEDSSQGTTTGVPTIAGNSHMLVYNIEGGVGVVPVVEQQVSIYNAAGQLVTSQYLTDEVHIPLPTGIYLIAGKNEMAKVVVR